MTRFSMILFGFSLLFGVTGLIQLSGQSQLSLDEVLVAVKENNYDLQAARQNIKAAEVLTSKYNRGYRPTLGINAGLGYDLNSIRTVYNFNFPDLNISNIQAYSGNIGVGGSYLLYDGGQRNARNEKNEASLDVAHLQLENIQQLMSFNAAQLYYSLAQAAYDVELLTESLNISSERFKRARTYYDYGKVNKVDILNAEVDVSRDSISLISINNDIENLKWQLNQLTLRNDTDYAVDTSFVLEYELEKLNILQESMLQSNAELISLQKQADLVQYDLAIAGKINAPQITANGTYNINYQKNSSKSQLDLNRNNGLNLGVTASWNILDGGTQKVQEQLAAVDQETAMIAFKTRENELITQLNRLWNTYQNNLLTIRIEKKNIQINRANFDLVKALYENGQQSSVEFRQAQLNLMTARSQYYRARTNAKLVEVEMDYLLGK